MRVGTNLLRSDEKGTHRQTTCSCLSLGLRGLIIVQNVQQHARQQQHEAASASLHAREPIRWWTREDREPQMTFGHAVIRLFRQQICELLLLRVASHGHHSLDLNTQMPDEFIESGELTAPLPFSTASQFWQMKYDFCIVCRSRTMMYFRNHDADAPLPELSCHTRM